jgi:hypothetical protein
MTANLINGSRSARRFKLFKVFVVKFNLPKFPKVNVIVLLKGFWKTGEHGIKAKMGLKRSEIFQWISSEP